jgi:tetratricopeptide (TPR) repeat protein
MLGDDEGEGRRQLSEYVRLYGEGVDSLVAARQAFGDLQQIFKEISSYRREPTFNQLRVPVSPIEPESFTATELSDAEAAGEVARLHVEWGRLTDAEPLLGEALAGAPEYPPTQEAAGILALRTGEREKAREALEKALTLSPTNPVVLYALGVLGFGGELTARESALVEERLSAAAALHPHFMAPRRRLAALHRSRGEPDRALELLREARELAPTAVQLEVEEVRLLFEMGRTAEAESRIGDMVRNASSNSEAMDSNNLCWWGSLYGLVREVFPACERAHALEPEEYMYMDTLAFANAMVGDLALAAAGFREAVAQLGRKGRQEFKAQRLGWADRLARGENPFAGLSEAELLEEVEEEVGWGW